MNQDENTTKIAHFIAFAVSVAAVILFAFWVLVDWRQPYWSRIIEEHFAAIIGLPMSAAGAFIVVVFLRQGVAGPIEFEGMGFKFKGPSGAVVLWLMCFLGIVIGIKVLW